MSKRISIGKADTFADGKLHVVRVDGVGVVVAKTPSGFCAVRNRCSHMMLPLGGGSLENTVITCPWHNSQFSLCTGENLDWVRGLMGVRLPDWVRNVMAFGRKPTPLTTYTVVEEDGELFIELPEKATASDARQ
jgi:nitrite reductase/ring-hydroxylating ferredoxin subunit